MLSTDTTAKNYAATLANGEVVRSNVPWVVTHVEAKPDYRLFVRFIDGLEGEVHMRGQIFSDSAGVFASLRDAEVFRRVACDEGFVMWENGVDIAPDATHEDFEQFGVQVLT
jgi:hypothetical protein